MTPCPRHQDPDDIRARPGCRDCNEMSERSPVEKPKTLGDAVAAAEGKNIPSLPVKFSDHDQETEKLKNHIASLKWEIGHKDKTLKRKNRLLDALGMVWCDGGCNGGFNRYGDVELTEEMVSEVERNTKRLRTWLINKNYRDSHK